MRLRTLVSSLLLAGCLTGCSNLATTIATKPAVAKRAYHGTASVGDFLTITIDPSAQIISYTDITNGQSAAVIYTVNADGSYALSDPTGNFIAAYEVPNYAMVIESMKSGPSANTPALITAVESGPINLSTFESTNYNYMQFRTNSGGLGVGSADISSSTVSISEYWPYGAVSGGSNSAFNTNSMPLAGFAEDPSGTFLSALPTTGEVATLFGTANGFFVVDTENGSILGLQKATSAAFNSASAGTYSALYYQKTGAQTGMNNVETGTASFGKATIAIGASGSISITDSTGKSMATGTLIPVSSASYLYGSASELQDPCNGMFTFRVTKASSQQDIFVTFINGAMLFSSFQAPLPWNNTGSTYNYFYGVGLTPAS
jgi:hypothetical protein